MQTEKAKIVQEACIIIWDEAPMIHRYAIEAVDRALRDVMGVIDAANEHPPFGGKVVVFGGDFRQVLPVVPRGDQIDQINASLTRSALWSQVRVFNLTINMRLQNLSEHDGHAQRQREFAKYLLDVGNGRTTRGTVTTIYV